MGENAFRADGGNQYIFTGATILATQQYVVFQTTGSTPEPPPASGVTGDRLGVVFFGQTINEETTRIILSPLSESGIHMLDPDLVNYYYSETDPYHISSLNLPAGIYTSDWSGSTAGSLQFNGAATYVTNADVGLTLNSHMMSCLTTSGNPSATISAGNWEFDLRVLGDANSELQFNVYKSEVIDKGETYNLYSNDTYLFSGTTGALSSGFVDYNIVINYGSAIVF